MTDFDDDLQECDYAEHDRHDFGENVGFTNESALVVPGTGSREG